MGAIWMTVMQYAGFLSEFAGYKAGLALTRKELHEHLRDMPSYDGFVKKPDDEVVRVRSEEVQEVAGYLLYSIGNIEVPHDSAVMIDVYHKYKNDPEKLKVFMDVSGGFAPFINAGIDKVDRTGAKSIDPEPYLLHCFKLHGKLGVTMGLELIKSFNMALHLNPWGKVRHVEWKDERKLRELFKSEALTTQYGTFLDQRFIDYLSNNFGKIDDMNWRKFEGLTAEFFKREGYRVELGPGRGDDGVDVRVWPDGAKADAPPLVLVQCKREGKKIGKVIVKSLYADVQHEHAKSGMIVTTSRLSPGAEATRKARGYPIDVTDREKLAKWITQMRTPGTGVFLSE